MMLALALCVLVYCAYLLWHAAHLPPAAQHTQLADYPRVTVVVPARNEAGTIAACLTALVQQEYPADKLEIIVVDDHSEDHTAYRVQQLEQQYEGRIHLLRLSDTQGAGKKAALTAGIALSQGELILTTDADCSAPAGWVWRMVSYMTDDVALVVGPIAKTYSRGSMFEQLQAVESAGMLALTAGAIGLGRPTQCNGANLAFRKRAFDAVGGYAAPVIVASGDDELLLHKVHRARIGRIVFATHADAVVHTPALPTWRNFVQQRLRWVSKSRAYRYAYMTASQLLAYAAHAALLALLLWALVDAALWWVVLPLLVLKLMADASLVWPATALTQQRALRWWVLPAQLWHLPYVLWVGLAGNLKRQYSWKGRRVH